MANFQVKNHTASAASVLNARIKASTARMMANVQIKKLQSDDKYREQMISLEMQAAQAKIQEAKARNATVQAKNKADNKRNIERNQILGKTAEANIMHMLMGSVADTMQNGLRNGQVTKQQFQGLSKEMNLSIARMRDSTKGIVKPEMFDAFANNFAGSTLNNGAKILANDKRKKMDPRRYETLQAVYRSKGVKDPNKAIGMMSVTNEAQQDEAIKNYRTGLNKSIEMNAAKIKTKKTRLELIQYSVDPKDKNKRVLKQNVDPILVLEKELEIEKLEEQQVALDLSNKYYGTGSALTADEQAFAMGGQGKPKYSMNMLDKQGYEIPNDEDISAIDAARNSITGPSREGIVHSVQTNPTKAKDVTVIPPGQEQIKISRGLYANVDKIHSPVIGDITDEQAMAALESRGLDSSIQQNVDSAKRGLLDEALSQNKVDRRKRKSGAQQEVRNSAIDRERQAFKAKYGENLEDDFWNNIAK